jgi:hypothetical protein
MRAAAVILALAGTLAAEAEAQPPSPSLQSTHWGIAGSFVPQWEFLDFVEDSMDRSIDMSGRDVQIGIIRGRQLGGDWGASYIRRRVDDGSTLLEETTKCVARPGQADICARGTIQRTRGVSLTGLQFHRFFAVGTIARRVQIGAVVSGGFGRLRGRAEQTQEHLQVTVNPANGQTAIGIASETETIDAREIFDHLPINEYMPMGGVEGALAILVAPGVKLRFSAGANFPGVHRFGVTAQYLFGAR